MDRLLNELITSENSVFKISDYLHFNFNLGSFLKIFISQFTLW